MGQEVERAGRVDVELWYEIILILKLYEVLWVRVPALDVLTQRQVVLEDQLQDLSRAVLPVGDARVLAGGVWLLEYELVLITGFLDLGLEVFEFRRRHEDPYIGIVLLCGALVVHVETHHSVETEERQFLDSLVVLRPFEEDVG